jgi:excinuclease ABC subunit C
MSSSQPPSPPLLGAALIADHVSRLPAKPGVYRMMDAHGAVLYVGKAKSLKHRVSNYTRIEKQPNRIARMIVATTAMEFILTDTETEALLLEANLIKRLKPRYNILLRDDKSFPYIVLRRDHDAPQVLKHRGARSLKGDYYGPFASAQAVNRTLDTLQKAFLLRTCSDPVYEGRTRPCMLHQIKRCAAPCTGAIHPEDYGELVAQAKAFLQGKSNELGEALNAQMQAAAQVQDFERAAEIRDRIRALAAVTAHQGVNPGSTKDADVIALHMDGGASCVRVFFYRAGQNWGERAFFPRHDKSAEAGAILGAFLAQFYENKRPPQTLVISHDVPEQDLLCEALGVRAGRHVQIIRPRRGEKLDLLRQALDNARDALGRRLAESSSRATQLAGIAKVFGLDQPPERIEVYDNSHISGTHAVGAMIVAGPDGYEKNQYRIFNIRSDDLAPGDDFAMMREVLTRRFSRLRKEMGKGTAIVPDLVLVDGGAGQLKEAVQVMTELGIDASHVRVAGIAKGVERDAGREQFFLPGQKPFRLEQRDPVLYYLQRLRDEAHRYAIGAHRRRRAKGARQNPLDAIPGVGPLRKKALLARFGSAKAVSNAKLGDLASTTGVSKQMAKAIFDYFHDEF